MESLIKQHLQEYQNAAEEHLRIYWMNTGAAEALKRLLDEGLEQGQEEQPAPVTEETKDES